MACQRGGERDGVGILLKGAVGTAEPGDAPVLVESGRDARGGEGKSDEQQERGPTERVHRPADSGGSGASGQEGHLTPRGKRHA